MTPHLLKFGEPPQADVLEHVFNPEVIARWRRSPDRDLSWRLEVIEASDQLTGDHWQRTRAAWRATYREFIIAAYECGLITSDGSSDVLARLRDRNSNNFRGAMAECEACWFFSRHLQLQTHARPSGRDGKVLDLGVRSAEIDTGVEVKSPFKARPDKGGWSGGEHDKVVQSIRDADGKFLDQCPNIVVLVPQLRVSLFESRKELLRAVFGATQYVVQAPVENTTEPGHFEFSPRGLFLRRLHSEEKQGAPGFQRVSAVMVLEMRLRLNPHRNSGSDWFGELFDEIESAAIDPKAFIVANPHCHHPLPSSLWGEIPQFVEDGQKCSWSDGGEIVW